MVLLVYAATLRLAALVSERARRTMLSTAAVRLVSSPPSLLFRVVGHAPSI